MDAAHFRTVIGHFASGVVIVAASDDDGPVGFTCQSFFSLSLDPPLIALAPSRTSTSWPRVHNTGRFCVNVLSAEQEELGRSFAISGGEKFRGVAWQAAASGSPILDGVIAWIDCTIETVHEAGDHYLVLARVTEMEISRRDVHPLVFYRGGFANVEI